MELAGFWMALATFLGIWWGHVGVRAIERRSVSIIPPMVILAGVGIALNLTALFTRNLTLSGVLSIIGITLMWDSFEVYRQQKRVIKGHAPANPNNPRHVAILAASSHATEADLLDREPSDPYASPGRHTPNRTSTSISTD
ncbi:MAG: DUF4491 family protein [Oscillochloris sp.]|nr:DUF4491 family protein [Oscillochloris sp.]